MRKRLFPDWFNYQKYTKSTSFKFQWVYHTGPWGWDTNYRSWKHWKHSRVVFLHDSQKMLVCSSNSQSILFNKGRLFFWRRPHPFEDSIPRNFAFRCPDTLEQALTPRFSRSDFTFRLSLWEHDGSRVITYEPWAEMHLWVSGIHWACQRYCYLICTSS